MGGDKKCAKSWLESLMEETTQNTYTQIEENINTDLR
jgi:hypothetical protein